MHYGNIESRGLLYNRTGVLFSETREMKGRLGNKGQGNNGTRRVGSKVTKHDIFHSEIHYNTTNQRPQKEPSVGGRGVEAATAGLHSRLEGGVLKRWLLV